MAVQTPPAPPSFPAPMPIASGKAAPVDFNRAPFLVIWEVTRACALACVHCRASAIPRRDPRELTTEEGFRLLDEVRAFSDPPPLLVLTGGDPMWRRDLVDLVAYGRSLGLSVALTPSGTAAPTRKRLEALREAGLSRLAVSLDAADPDTHDAFRRVKGSYRWTMRIVQDAIELGIPLQINTTVSRLTLGGLEAMVDWLRGVPIVLWAVFFLVQTGRGSTLEPITAAECEATLHWLARLAPTVRFGIKTTEAPQYRRVLAQTAANITPGVRAARFDPTRAPRSVTDGNGLVFVDHIGDICPSGFLPSVSGNVRTASLVDVYRHDPSFVALRDGSRLGGRCGRCEFRDVCGGSRARAFAATGDPLAEDPLCPYVPATLAPS